MEVEKDIKNIYLKHFWRINYDLYSKRNRFNR